MPVSGPQLKPDTHSRQEAVMHVVAVVPAFVLHAAPFARRAAHVPAPLQ
jgi:hypothetical protein